MNQEHSTNYEDHIKFLIALMTKDYEKAQDIGNQLLKQNRNDIDVVRALNILKHKKHEECERSSLSESKREGSVATDGDNTDFIDDNVDTHVDLEIASKILLHDTFRLDKEPKACLDLKQKMHRVIPIKMNKKSMQTKNLTRH